MEVTKSDEQELYVIPQGKGYSCLGYDVALNRLRAGYLELCEQMPTVERGSLEAYEALRTMENRFREMNRRSGYRARYELQSQLIGLEGKRVEVLQDGRTRRFIVGKSVGPIPIHLEIARRDSTGGMGACGPYDYVRVVGRGRA